MAFMAQGMTRLVTDLAEQFRHLSVSGLELAEIGEQHWRQEEIAGAQPLTNNGNSFRADQLLRADARTPQNEALGKFDDLMMSPQMGKIAYLVIARAGIFGIGEKIHAGSLGGFQVNAKSEFVGP